MWLVSTIRLSRLQNGHRKRHTKNISYIYKIKFVDRLNFKNLRNLARHKFFKFPKHDTEMSKHVGVTII